MWLNNELNSKWWYPFLVDGDPVGWLEPAVVFDVVDAVAQVAVTFRQVDLQQVAQQILQIGAEMRRKSHLQIPINIQLYSNYIQIQSNELVSAAAYPSRDDSLVDLDGLVGEERRVPGRHFVHQDTQRPPIHRFVVTLFKKIKSSIIINDIILYNNSSKSWKKKSIWFIYINNILII